MKRAIFKIGQSFQVISTHHGENGSGGSEFSLNVDVDTWAQSPDWTFNFDVVKEGLAGPYSSEAGTKIVVDKLHPSVGDDLGDATVVQLLKTELKIRHQPSIQAGMIIELNGETLVASQPALQSSDMIRPIAKSFTVGTGDKTVEVELYAGTIASQRRADLDPDLDEGQAEHFQDPSEAGWYFFCNDRLLLVADRTPLTGWGSPAAAYHPQYRYFRGFVYLSADDASLLPWNTTKTAVDRDSAIFREVQKQMKLALVAVQAGINRAKTEKSRTEDGEDFPAIVTAFEQAPDRPLSALDQSERMILPEPPARRKVAAPAMKIQRIQYAVDLDRYWKAAKALDASSASELGRLTFDYFYQEEID